jgi:B12 binding domain
MRVLLAQPPLQPGREVTPPLGLCTLASWLQSSGHEIRVLDLDLQGKPASGPPERTCTNFLTRSIADFDPAVVGVTSMYNNSLQVQHLLQLAKQVNSAIVTVSGGSHFGAQGIQSLRRIPELDYVIEGEAELAFASFLEALEQQGESRRFRVYATGFREK